MKSIRDFSLALSPIVNIIRENYPQHTSILQFLTELKHPFHASYQIRRRSRPRTAKRAHALPIVQITHRTQKEISLRLDQFEIIAGMREKHDSDSHLSVVISFEREELIESGLVCLTKKSTTRIAEA